MVMSVDNLCRGQVMGFERRHHGLCFTGINNRQSTSGRVFQHPDIVVFQRRDAIPLGRC